MEAWWGYGAYTPYGSGSLNVIVRVYLVLIMYLFCHFSVKLQLLDFAQHAQQGLVPPAFVYTLQDSVFEVSRSCHPTTQ